jgi:hypothetical protein
MITDELRVRADISIEDSDILQEAAARVEVVLYAVNDLIAAHPNADKMLLCAERIRYALLAKPPTAA